MKLAFNNSPIFYSTKGKGKPLVLLHGFLESSNIWKPFIEELSHTRKVICIDLPGHGKTGIMGTVHTMELMADVVKIVLDELQVQSASLVGHSMGGYVSLAFTERFPEMVRSITLMNSTPEEDSEERKINRDRAIKLIEKDKKAFVNMAISNLFTRENNKIFKEEIESLKEKASGFSSEGIIASIKGMKIRTDRTVVLKKINIPKTMIAGKKDPVTDWKRIEKVAKDTGCTLFITENGHLAFLEDAAEIRTIMHFID